MPTGYARAQMELLKTAWSEYRAISVQIQITSNNENIKTAHTALQKQYAMASGVLTDIIRNSENKSNIELPKIKLPEFYGKNTEWCTFVELFNKIVHCNNNINDAIKMQYLKTSLKGEAAKLVSHISPTAENYKTCYEILHNRYENKRELLGKLFDAILSLPKHKTENSAELRKIHDTANETILAIKNLGIDTSSWDPFINHILLGKLHHDTIKHYECQLINIKEVESFKEFLAYIESRCLAIQSAEYKTINVPFTVNHDLKEKNFKCFLCANEHSISKCQQFLKKEVKERSEIIKEKKLCVNCLGPHKFEECKSKFTCGICKKKHHSLLHFGRDIKANIATVEEEDGEVENKISISSNIASSGDTVMLATALVNVQSKTGENIIMKVLVDQGSQSSFITEEAYQTLQLNKNKCHAEVSGIGETKSIARHSVNLVMCP